MTEASRKPETLGGRSLGWAVFSPILWRIMAVNLLALGAFGGGVLYLDQFRDNLMAQHVASLAAQAEIIAASLGESAAAGPESRELEPLAARQIVSRLVGQSGVRARLFSVDGELIADSRDLGTGYAVHIVPLPETSGPAGLRNGFIAWLNRTLDDLAFDESLASYEESAEQRASNYAEVISALGGEAQTVIRRLDQRTLILSVSAPVVRFRRILGALMLSDDSTTIQAIIEEERLNILRVISIALGVTLLLSIFLAGTIARPIRGLARAADEVKGGIGRSEVLQKFTRRRDEIGNLSRSVASMTRTLYRQLDAMESFAADVTHELKNPLTSLRSAVETVQRTDDAEVQAKLLAIILDDVGRLDRLISDISDASRLDAELSRSKMEPVDMGLLTATLVNAYSASSTNLKVKLELKAPEKGSFMVKGIEGRLAQVLRNLIDNALSFTAAGGAVHIAFSEDKDCITITVDDEGPGLPEGAEDRIFERFYSERPEGEAFGRHSGLGLSISRQIIEAHGGRLEAVNRTRSGLEQSYEQGLEPAAGDILGARFSVELPSRKRT